jgi:hypothetical protein
MKMTRVGSMFTASAVSAVTTFGCSAQTDEQAPAPAPVPEQATSVNPSFYGMECCETRCWYEDVWVCSVDGCGWEQQYKCSSYCYYSWSNWCVNS